MIYPFVVQIPYLTCLALGNTSSMKFVVHFKFEALGI